MRVYDQEPYEEWESDDVITSYDNEGYQCNDCGYVWDTSYDNEEYQCNDCGYVGDIPYDNEGYYGH